MNGGCRGVIRIILLGPPGAGKGTQAEFISQRLGIPHIASGDLFREAQSKGTPLGLLARSHIEKGTLVPDEVTVAMILERIAATDCEEGYILDGFPRTLEQARALDKALADMGDTIDKVVYIKVSNDQLLLRLSGRRVCRNCQALYHLVNSPPKVVGKCDYCGGELYQRADDSEEVVGNRLKVYVSQTAPLIDYYRAAGKLVEVDGGRGVGEVTMAIIAAICQSGEGSYVGGETLT